MKTSGSLFDEILAGAPSHGTLILVLSRMKEEGHFKRVIQECLKALETYPCDIPVRRLLAETYFESGRISQAESELNRVIAQIDELAAPAYRLQAELLVRQNREREAIAPLKCYLAHRSDDTEARRVLEGLETPEEENPDDRVAGNGLAELKDRMVEDRTSMATPGDTGREKKLKIISILEDWRERLAKPGPGTTGRSG